MTYEEALEKLKANPKNSGVAETILKAAAKRIAKYLPADATDEQTETLFTEEQETVSELQGENDRRVNLLKKELDGLKKQAQTEQAGGAKKAAAAEEDDAPAWFKKYQEQNDAKITAIEKKGKKEAYQKALKERFKGVDEDFYALAMEGREFESDEEVETFAKGVESRWSAYSQKLADEGLSRLSKPAGGSTRKTDELPAEIKARAARNQEEAEKATPAIQGLPQQNK